MTTKKSKETFTGPANAAKQAFNDLKLAFTMAPVLQHFNPSLPSMLVTDASDYAFASILLQPDKENLLHPVAYYSRKFASQEINYEIHDKELLAIINSFWDMHSWLIGSPLPITVISDHKNIEYLMTSQAPNHQQAHWSMFLSQFDFKLDYTPGKKNPANTPSRHPDYVPQEGDEVVKFQNKSLVTNYHSDWLFSCLHSLTSSSPQILSLTMFMINNSELLEQFKDTFQNDTEWCDAMSKSDNTFSFSGNLVFHNNHLFVPSSLRSEILYSRHNLVLVGHPG